MEAIIMHASLSKYFKKMQQIYLIGLASCNYACCSFSIHFIYSFTFVFQGKYQKVVELWKGNMQLQFKKVEYMHE